jgi:N,N'-diacetyllegionaminate synthase
MNKRTPAYILAEMASSHEGKLKTAEFIIDSAAKAGANGILFQLMNLATYIIPSDEDYPDTESFYMNQNNWAVLIDRANNLGLDVWANVYDLESAEFCKNKKIKGYKLHSSNLENEKLVKEITKEKKEILISVGGTSREEIKDALDLIHSMDPKANLYLMYGLQNFPTNPEGINLNFIKEMAEDFGVPFGYQDHSEPTSAASTYLPVFFMGNGASIIEKHITYDRSLKGQDYEAALNPDEFLEFVKNIRIVDTILNKEPEEVSADELKYREYKTLMKVVAKENIKVGELFTLSNVAVMRAKKGEVNGKKLDSVLGHKAQSAYKKFEPLKRSELFKAGIFITARLKSKRLPLKVIKPILGKPMIEWMIDRLKHCGIDPIVMMTSTNPQDDPLIEIAKKNGIPYFRGSEDDVLIRIRDCARQFDVDLIASVTADDPFKEPILIEEMIRRYVSKGFDFCEVDGVPNGCESYVISRSAIEKACEIKAASDTEIWGPYFKEAGVFKCDVLKVTDPRIQRPQYRITVDTPEDFELVSKIFEILTRKKDYFNIFDICQLLDENPDMVAINAHIQQRKAPKAEFKK